MSIVALQLRNRYAYKQQQIFWIDGHFVGTYSGKGAAPVGGLANGNIKMGSRYHIFQ